MSKELVISATPHETRVAILEDGHLCEIYIEREKEFALVGSIYKGRVTRVLPGMQSAFVDIGRDTDAFLYVSDFLENLEDYDHVTADEAKAHAPAAPVAAAPAALPASAPYVAPAPTETFGGSGIGVLEGETIGGASREHSAFPPASGGEPASAPYSQTPGVAPDFDPTAENPAHGSAAIEPSDSAPPHDYVAPVPQSQGNYPPSPVRTHSSGQGQHDRPRNDRGFVGGGGRGGRDRGGNRGGGRFRRGGGRDRGGRPQGRDLPASKYASSSGTTRAPYSPHSPAGSFAPRDNKDDFASAAENLPPIILPGESLAKYKERPAVTPPTSSNVADLSAAPASTMGYEHPEGFGDQAVPPQHSDSELPASLYTNVESVAPPTSDLHIEPSHEASFPMGHEEQREAARDTLAETHEESTEVKDSHDRFANLAAEAESVREEWIGNEAPRAEHSSASAAEDEHTGMGLTHGSPADLTDEQARTLAESLVEAKHEEAHDEVDEDAALATGGADFSDAEADAAHAEAHDEMESDEAEVNGNVHDENHEDGGHESHDEAADAAHDEAHNANIDAGDAEAIHAAGEFAEPGTSELTSAEQQQNDQKFNREPRSARVEDPRRNARFARPQRRSGGGQRGGRPMRHGRPPERHGRPSSGGHAPQRRPQLISEMLKAGQEIIVQIAKEPLGKKGARITSHVALPGRFLVYMPTVNHIGVSRKISSAETRSRLRSIVGEYKSTFPGGFIVRTAAGNVSDADLRMDIEFLGKTWHEICARSENKKAPALVHRDLNLVERILRDYVSSDYTSIWIDNEEEFSKVVEFVSRFQPDLVSRVKLYTKEAPIFEEFGIQQELDKAMRPKVWLKSGGYIVINHTEALVAIDVNTGKFVGRGSTRLEDTIVKTNLEAVKEIVRQIRLRDLGGIIIVDFIDMEERRNRDKVMHAIDDELRADKAPSKVLSFNEFGLVAITRKRTKQALEKVLCQPCPYCTGSGMVKSIPTICFEIQMEARKMAADLDSASVTLRVHPEIAKALKTRESALVEELESISKKSVIIQSDPTLHWEQYDIY
jgi:Rne/Rng family ribonuclease